MTNDPRTQPLLEWNRLARENTENAIVSSMFEAACKASKPMEIFTTWLLVATAGILSFLIVNTDKLLPIIKQSGFITCGVFLCLSCAFGLLSKIFALRCKISVETSAASRKTFDKHLAKYEEEEESKIQQSAELWGINLETGIRIERVLNQFLSPLPRWVGWFALRQLKKNAGNPQVGYLSQIKNPYAQSLSAFLQALLFFGFLGSGFVFAAAT